MVRALHAVVLLAAVTLLVALRVPYASSVGSEALEPEASASALQVMSRPAEVGFLSAFDASRPLLPPLLLAVVYQGLVESGLAGDGVRDDASFAARVRNGSPIAMRAGAWTWLALEATLLVLLALLVGRLARHVGLSPLAGPLAVLLLVATPVALAGARRLDGALLAAIFATAAALLAAWSPGERDHLRWVGAGVLLGVCAATHPLGFLALALLLLLVAFHAPVDALVRLGISLVAFLMGVVIGDPRLVDGLGPLTAGAADAVVRADVLGRAPAPLQLLRGISPAVSVLSLGGLAVLAARGRRGAAIAAALGLSAAVPLLLPGSNFSAVVLAAPFACAAASLGGMWIGSRRSAALGVVLVCVAVAWPAAQSLDETRKVRRGDSRRAAAEWLRENLPADARIVTDFYGPALPEGHVTFTLPFDVQRPELYAGAYDLGWYDGFDTFVLVGTQFDRYRRDPERHRAQLAFVSRLAEVCERVASFDRREYTGPDVTILRRPGAPTGADLDRLLSRLPPSPPVPGFYLSLGAAYDQMGRIEEAKRFLTIAAHLAPGDPRLAVNLSSIYIEEGSYMEADSLLELAVHASPTNAKLRYQYGLVKQERGRHGDAIGEYKMAVRYDPTYAEAFFNLAICYFEVGNLDGAKNAFRRVTELVPSGRMREEALRMIGELNAL